MSEFSFKDNATVYEKFTFAFNMLIDPYIVISLILTLIAGLAWMIAMTKFDISYAYPYTIFGFVLVLLFSSFLFGEPITWQKLVGLFFITIGLLISSKSL